MKWSLTRTHSWLILRGVVLAWVCLALGAPHARAVDADRTDALVLYAAGAQQPADFGLRKIGAFYGLQVGEVDLANITLTDALLRDEAGAYIPTVVISGNTLDTELDATEVALLKAAVEVGGANVLVSTVHAENSAGLAALTNGEVLGSRDPADSRKDYHITDAAPVITREFTGLRIGHDSEQLDFALRLAPVAPRTQALIISTDDEARPYPMFARHQQGAGSVFVSSETPDFALRYGTVWENYYAFLGRTDDGGYRGQRVAQILPLMMFVRYTAGDEAWHRDRDFANLTVDDPALRMASLDYPTVLAEIIAHNYHLTIGMPGGSYQKSQQDIIDLFHAHPDRLSLALHGNNHDGFEFFHYTPQPGSDYPARPIEEQEADIVEGLTRLAAHQRATGLPFGRVMIFPFSISPGPTLPLLKQYNLQSTINALEVPLGETRVNEMYSYMYPAELSYHNFAVIGRRDPGETLAPFDLFIDKPVFTYDHNVLYNRGGPAAFNPFADAINALHGDVEWQGLGYIMNRLYLEKTNDDASVDVMFFGNHLTARNDSGAERVYHVRRAETGEVRIAQVTVDGAPADYTVEGGQFQVDITIPPGAERTLQIRYAPQARDFAIGAEDVVFDPATSVMSVTVHNQSSEAGPVSVGVYHGSPEAANSLLALTTAQRIAPGASQVVTATLAVASAGGLTVAVDPYDVVVETDESDNRVELADPLALFRQFLPFIVQGSE